MKKFDKEYSTQWNLEVEHLEKSGIKYVFVKKINEVDTYKYKKNANLFLALYRFYINL